MATDQPIANPTFHQNIKAMFSQYDQVMMLNYFDLHDYNQVKAWGEKFILVLQPNADPKMAALGWSMMQQVHVMPEVPGPWPASWVQTFKNWVANGCPEGTPPTIPAAPVVSATVLQQFIALSQALTGIESFGPNGNQLATIYYNRLLLRPANAKKPDDTLAGILAAWAKSPDPKTIAANFPIYSDIITIWYNATTNWDNNGKPVVFPALAYYGTPDFNQYTESLVWKVVLAHPMGYAPENSPFYWQVAPTPDGQYTGLYDKNY